MFGKKRRQTVIIAIVTIIFLLSLKVVLNPSRIIISGISNLICPEAISYFETDDHIIALTIDDSPDDNHSFSNTTLGILDILANYDVKATFFIITNKAKK